MKVPLPKPPKTVPILKTLKQNLGASATAPKKKSWLNFWTLLDIYGWVSSIHNAFELTGQDLQFL